MSGEFGFFLRNVLTQPSGYGVLGLAGLLGSLRVQTVFLKTARRIGNQFGVSSDGHEECEEKKANNETVSAVNRDKTTGWPRRAVVETIKQKRRKNRTRLVASAFPFSFLRHCCRPRKSFRRKTAVGAQLLVAGYRTATAIKYAVTLAGRRPSGQASSWSSTGTGCSRRSTEMTT